MYSLYVLTDLQHTSMLWAVHWYNCHCKESRQAQPETVGLFYAYENAISYTRPERHVSERRFSLHTDRIVSIAACAAFCVVRSA